METSGADLLSGISESFDFASPGDTLEDNSSLAQSISLIQQTLDQSIAQAECLGPSPHSSPVRNQHKDDDRQIPQLEEQSQKSTSSLAPTPNRSESLFPRSPLLSPQGSMSTCTQQQPSGNVNAQSTPIGSLATRSPNAVNLPNGGAAVVSSPLSTSASSSFDSLTPVDCNKPVTLKEYRLVFTEQVRSYKESMCIIK